MKRTAALVCLIPLWLLVGAGARSNRALAALSVAPRGSQLPIASQLVLSRSPGADLFTDGRERIGWVTKHSVVVYDLGTHREKAVASSQTADGSVGPAEIAGSWLVYLDDPEPVWSGARWILVAKNIRTDRTMVIARADTTIQHASRLIPSFALSSGRVVWTFWRGQVGRLTSMVGLFDLNGGRFRVLARSHTPVSFGDVALFGHAAAWTVIRSVTRGNRPPVFRSSLRTEDLSTGKVTSVSVRGGVSEPSIWGKYLVYKGAATRYDVGNLYLYNMQDGTTVLVQRAAVTPEGPSVGASIVTWSELGRGRVGVYQLASSSRMYVRPSDGGRSVTAGKVLLYVAPKNPTHPAQGFEVVIDVLR